MVHDSLEKIAHNKERLQVVDCWDEKVTGKRLFSVQYRGFDTSRLIRKLMKAEVPIKPILTTKKLKTILLSLKALVEDTISSNVV